MIANYITDAISQIAPKYHSITKVGIFGSYARGENSIDSDIDIVYEYNENNNDDEIAENIFDLFDDLENKFIKFDFVSLNSLNSPMLENVLKDVIWLYQRD